MWGHGPGLGAVVKRLRTRPGQRLSQEALAAREPEELSQTFISSVESGSIKQPTADKLRALARALGVEYNELLVEAGWVDPVLVAHGQDDIAVGLLQEAERRHPRVVAELLAMKDENTADVYALAQGVVADFLAQGVKTAQDVVNRTRRIKGTGAQDAAEVGP